LQHEALQVTKCNEISHVTVEQNSTSTTVSASIIMNNDVTEWTRTADTQYCSNIKVGNVIFFLDILHWEDYEDSFDCFCNDKSF
jgi:hypothetical protein